MTLTSVITKKNIYIPQKIIYIFRYGEQQQHKMKTFSQKIKESGAGKATRKELADRHNFKLARRH